MNNHKKKQFVLKKGFTLIEVSVALIILGMIIAAVIVVINRAMETIGEWQTRMEAFEISRENMEKLLAQKSLTDKVEYGTSETNPDITWRSAVESFYEPVSNRMWMRAVCTSEYKDSNGVDQKIELTQWLTSLTKDQIAKILEQQGREKKYLDGNDANYADPNEMRFKNNQNPNGNQNQPTPGQEQYTPGTQEPISPDIQKIFNDLKNSTGG